MKARKEALDAGILVVTCSGRFLPYGCVMLTEGKDPDQPESYRRGRYSRTRDKLLIPAANKTVGAIGCECVYV